MSNRPATIKIGEHNILRYQDIWFSVIYIRNRRLIKNNINRLHERWLRIIYTNKSYIFIFYFLIIIYGFLSKEGMLPYTSSVVLPLQVLTTEMSKVYKTVSTEIM